MISNPSSIIPIIYLFIVGCSSSSHAQPNGMGAGKHKELVINSQTVCGNIRGLNKKQTKLCNDDAHAVASALQGMKRAIHECQIQFKNERWNCSVMGTRDDLITYNSPFLQRGFRETAFSFALASAGVTHAVALACGLNMISVCECPKLSSTQMTASQRKRFHKQQNNQNKGNKGPNNTVYEAPGCDHNINYGMKFSADFLDTEASDDLLAMMRFHNNRVGRLQVAHTMRNNCKCHGTSGSCVQKTCWESTPDFKVVALKLKEKYRNATNLEEKSSGNAVFNRPRGNRINQEEINSEEWNNKKLVFFEKSPEFCDQDRSIDVLGTRGRYCNDSIPRTDSNNTESCHNMCCSRRHQSYIITRQEDCNCTFHWCCYVNCDKCNSTERISVCN